MQELSEALLLTAAPVQLNKKFTFINSCTGAAGQKNTNFNSCTGAAAETSAPLTCRTGAATFRIPRPVSRSGTAVHQNLVLIQKLTYPAFLL